MLFSIFVGLAAGTASAADAPRENVAGLRTSFADVISQVAPAVVNIYTLKVVHSQASPFAGDPFYKMFFGGNVPGISRDRVERSLGSGVIVRPDGLMVTNYHVIRGAQQVRVVLQDRRELPATLIDADPQLDVAVMKIKVPEGTVLPHAAFGNSDTLRVGDVVLAIGNPFGVGQSVSQGIVSALDRTNVEQSQVASFIQTDAAINPGNSGGALIDTNGKVIGINSAIFTSSGSSSGVGFAIPSRAVVSVINSVLETGQVEHAWLGAAGQDLTMDLAQKLGLPAPSGVLINQVEPGSPAAQADIRVGDIIQAFDGQPTPDSKSLESDVATSPVNTRVKLKLWRSGSEMTVDVDMSALPKQRPEDTLQVSGDNPLNGYTVANIGPGLAQQFNLPMNAHGVMVTGGPQAGTVGLQVGDILLAVNRIEIHALDDLKQALKAQGGAWEIVFRRGSRVFRTFLQ